LQAEQHTLVLNKILLNSHMYWQPYSKNRIIQQAHPHLVVEVYASRLNVISKPVQKPHIQHGIGNIILPMRSTTAYLKSSAAPLNEVQLALEIQND